jgi:peptidyl-prolyl cis-trans isomerase SurA
MNFRALAIATLFCLLSPTLLAQNPQSADFIVAVVNSEPITNSEVRAETKRVVERLREQNKPVPDAQTLQNGVLERLINDRAQLQLARDTGIRLDEAAIDLAEQNLARQNDISVAELHKRIAKDGISVATFRAQLKDQQTLARLVERDVESRIRISEQDIDRFLADLQKSDADPYTKEINLAQILIAVPERASAEESAARFLKAKKVLERLRNGEDFLRVMQEVSAADRANRGEIGLRRADRYPPSFVEATQKTEVGGISEIVRSGAGFHILKVVEKRNPATITRSVVQTRARHILLRPSPQMTQAAAITRLADYKKRILAGSATFAALAKEFSQDGSASQGGDLGWANPGMFVPEFEEVMNKLAEDDISSPLVSRFGVHLIQVTERRRVDLSPREMRDSVRAQLKETRSEEAYSTWVKDIRARAFVEVREPPQ